MPLQEIYLEVGKPMTVGPVCFEFQGTRKGRAKIKVSHRFPGVEVARLKGPMVEPIQPRKKGEPDPVLGHWSE